MHMANAELGVAEALPGLNAFLAPFSRIFAAPYIDPRGQPTNRLELLEDCSAGLLIQGERKTMLPVSAKLGQSWDRIQHFMTYSPWDHEEMQVELREQMRPHTSPEGFFIVDDVSEKKRGKFSVGVARQYLGCVGKVANGQVAVAWNYCLPSVKRNADAIHWPMAQRLYLGKDWTKDRARREAAKVPKDVTFKTKWQLALDLLDDVREQKLPHQGTLGDAGYGDVPQFRQGLREREEPYILGVTPTRLRVLVTRPTPGLGKGFREKPSTPKQIANALPSTAWRKIRWTPGDQTSRSAKFARVRVRVVLDKEPTAEEGWLLLEQRPSELKAYLSWRFEGTLRSSVLGAHQRWAVEKEFEELKNEVGWDHFEGRTWLGWHHHKTISMLCYAYLATRRAKAKISAVPPASGLFESTRHPRLPSVRA